MDTSTSRIKNLSLVALLFAVSGIILATLLICKHVFPDLCSLSMGCDLSGVDGCARLGADPRSKLFGFIPLAIPGFFYYVFMSLLLFRVGRVKGNDLTGLIQLLLMLAVFGVVTDSILAYINFYVMPVPCVLCAYSYVSTLGISISVLMMYYKGGKPAEGDDMKLLGRAIKSSIVPGGISLVATVVVLLGFFTAQLTAGPSLPEQAGVRLLPPEEVKSFIKDIDYLKKYDIPVRGLDNVEGPSSAYIVIHKFADFRCPHCYHAGEVLQQALKRWPGRIRIYYRHFPLDGTCNPLVGRKQEGAWSCNGAQAALCAPEQGLFPEMYHEIFNFQVTATMITPDNLKALTERLGGNWGKMVRCMSSARTNQDLLADIKEAEVLEVQATPTLTVNGHMLPSGTPDPGFFFNMLDALVYEKEGAAAYEEFRNRMNKD